MFRAISQIVSVTRFSLASLPQRLGSSASAMLGIAGVVAVMVGVLSIAQGIMSTMTGSSNPANVMVLRSGADTEMTSGLGGDDARLITEAPGLARHGEEVIASRELFVIINLPLSSTGTDANVPLRGIDTTAAKVRQDFEIVEGRMFEEGIAEVIVGVGASLEFAGMGLGDSVEIGSERWPVVGIFTTGGGVSESEVWGRKRSQSSELQSSKQSSTAKLHRAFRACMAVLQGQWLRGVASGCAPRHDGSTSKVDATL